MELVYVCSCGKTFEESGPINMHVLLEAKKAKEKKSQSAHTSRGLMDKATGEIVLPPLKERTPEQRKLTKKIILERANQQSHSSEEIPQGSPAAEKPQGDKPPAETTGDTKPPSEKKETKTGTKTKSPQSHTSMTSTQVPAEANALKLVSKVFTLDFTVVMRAGYQAAQDLWGWDVSFRDFIDTVIFRYFKRCGVTLAGYIIDETPEEQAVRLQRLQVLRKSRQEPVVEEERELEEVPVDGS